VGQSKAQWGRRGSTLQSDAKANDVPYEEAKRVYDRVFREKTGKGYKVAQSSGGATNGPLSVELLHEKSFPATHRNCSLPLTNRKHSSSYRILLGGSNRNSMGGGSPVEKLNGQYSGINKLGQVISIDTQLAASLDRVRADAFLVDGEITASRFDVWELLTVDHTNLRDQPYELRYAHLFCRFQRRA